VLFLVFLLLLYTLTPAQLISSDTIWILLYYFKYIAVTLAVFSVYYTAKCVKEISDGYQKRGFLFSPNQKRVYVKRAFIGVGVLLALEVIVRALGINGGVGIIGLSADISRTYLRLGEPCFTDDQLLRDITKATSTASKALAEAGIHHWIDFGTLLGAVRDHKIIPWDDDADLGALDGDQDAVTRVLTETFGPGSVEPADFTKDGKVAALRVKVKDVTMDFFFWGENEEPYARQALPPNNDGSIWQAQDSKPPTTTSPPRTVVMLHRVDKYSPVERKADGFAKAWIMPADYIHFGHDDISYTLPCPNHPYEFLQYVRYPNTYNKVSPRKLSCMLSLW